LLNIQCFQPINFAFALNCSPSLKMTKLREPVFKELATRLVPTGQLFMLALKLKQKSYLSVY